MTNKEYLGTLSAEEYVKTITGKLDEFEERNQSPYLEPFEVQINAKIDLLEWLRAECEKPLVKRL